MNIISIAPAHDGSIVLLNDGVLRLCIEGEKDSHDRYSGVSDPLIQTMIVDHSPEVISYFNKIPLIEEELKSEFAYFGLDKVIAKKSTLQGKEIDLFFSTHERAHLLSSYSMSPFPQGQPCYALCWEGIIGRFYFIDEALKITPFPAILIYPGTLYCLAYMVANGTKLPATSDSLSVRSFSSCSL